MTEQANRISVQGLELRYGKTQVLDGLDLEVPAGSVTALVGGNGCGKTSLLRVLAGELRPRRGQVQVLGQAPWKRTAKLRRRLGWVPERTDLPPWMKVHEHLRFQSAFYPTWDEAEAGRLMELFDLDPSVRYQDLSKGQRTLENLVVALAPRPELLLLDEPFSGLDVSARRDVFTGILEHLRGNGTSVLLASHSIRDIERCADRIALVASGRAVVTEELDALYDQSARLRIVLRSDSDWTAPGNALLESAQGLERILFYPKLTAEDRQAIAIDDAVDLVEILNHDLEDLLAATTRRRAA